MRTIDRSIVLTDQPLGTSQALTPEGFLYCREVPVARIGIQDYLNEELIDGESEDEELEPGEDGVIHVERREEDVFSPETLASLEGKDVTMEHPDELITPETHKEHSVGVTLNPRRGEGHLADYLIADLLIKDAAAIAAVRAGKRELSLGYDAKYLPIGPGRARQTNITHNHTALVEKGRCGSTCAIGDRAMTEKKPAVSPWEKLRAAFTLGDKKTFDEAIKEAETKDDLPSEAATHIHLHTGSTTADPALSADEDKTDEDDKDDKAPTLDERVAALEGGFSGISETLKELSGHVGKLAGGTKDRKSKDDGEDEETMDDEEEEEREEDQETGDEDGAEQAEEEGEFMDDGEEEQEPKTKAEVRDRRRSKDRKPVNDSEPLRALFRDTVAGAEIIAPGLKLPTFDSRQPRLKTVDSICLLRRRALAKMVTTDAGMDVMTKLTNKSRLPEGLGCREVGVVFKAAVGMTKDNATAAPTSLSKAKAPKETGKTQFHDNASFNARMKERFGG